MIYSLATALVKDVTRSLKEGKGGSDLPTFPGNYVQQTDDDQMYQDLKDAVEFLVEPTLYKKEMSYLI